MKKLVATIGIILFLIIVGFTGCFEDSSKNGKNDESIDSRFIGKWKNQDDENDIFEFKSNGSIYKEQSGKSIYFSLWKINGDLFCAYEPKYAEECYRFKFSNDNTIITFYNEENNSEETLIKQ